MWTNSCPQTKLGYDRWHAKTKYSHLPLLSKTFMSFDGDYFSLPLSSRDNRVRLEAAVPGDRRVGC